VYPERKAARARLKKKSKSKGHAAGRSRLTALQKTQAKNNRLISRRGFSSRPRDFQVMRTARTLRVLQPVRCTWLLSNDLRSAGTACDLLAFAACLWTRNGKGDNVSSSSPSSYPLGIAWPLASVLNATDGSRNCARAKVRRPVQFCLKTRELLQGAIKFQWPRILASNMVSAREVAEFLKELTALCQKTSKNYRPAIQRRRRPRSYNLSRFGPPV